MADEEKPKRKKVKPHVTKTTYFLNFFAWYIMTCVFAYIGAITFLTVPEGNTRFADTALGFLLGTVVAGIIVWAFRSSKAQADKENVDVQLKQINGKGGNE